MGRKRGIRETKAVLITFAVLMLTSCAGKPVPLSAPPAIQAEPAFLTAQPRHTTGSQDQMDMRTLIDEATRIVTSAEFERNLALIDEPIALSPFGERHDPSVVYTLLLGKDPAYSYVPTQVQWVERGGNSNNGEGDGSLINLTRRVQANWRSDDTRTRSLAINSMAHEMSHSLSRRIDTLDYVFVDKFFSFAWLRGSPPIASYTIGTVAQCTWLAEQEPLIVMDDCFRRYGLSKFNARP